MKAVIQRVKRATVKAGELEATIGPGMVVLVGLEAGDTEGTCAWAAERRIGPRPVSSHSAFEPVARHSAARNSTLGSAPSMYRRTVSAF